MTALHTLAALFMIGGATPPATTDCDPTDHGCKARRSEQRAASAVNPDDQATYLRSAHLSYLSLFDKTGDVHDLCTARRAFNASLAVKGQSADERARTRKLRGELVSREQKSAAPCKVSKHPRVSRPESPPIATSATSPVASSPSEVEPTSEPPPLLTSTSTPELPPTPASPRPRFVRPRR